MDSLILKLVLTPTLIGAASLAGRRWGPAVSGWLIGLPLTSGPIAFFLALNHGEVFAAAAALGTLSGAISIVIFCLAYGWLARRYDWPLVLSACMLIFAGSTAVLQKLTLPLAPLFLLVVLVLLAGLRLMPGESKTASFALSAPPRWDIPVRMLTATVLVLLLTEIAALLGPHLTGLLAPFPLYTAILTVFAHRLQGPAAAASVLRGLLFGLFAFASFFLVLAALIERAGITAAFLAAVLAAFVVQAGSLWLLRREHNHT